MAAAKSSSVLKPQDRIDAHLAIDAKFPDAFPEWKKLESHIAKCRIPNDAGNPKCLNVHDTSVARYICLECGADCLNE